MEQFNKAPSGVPQDDAPAAHIVRPSGWRKATVQNRYAKQRAKTGTQSTITKGRALIATKRVARHIGLKAADLLLLDTLCAFSKPQDWEEGRDPIVWPSNLLLMDQTGFSRSTLKRHARRLIDLGLIAPCDSPNGKRWGHRDSNGVIIRAYGYSLAPMAANTLAFEEDAQNINAERNACQQLKREITVLRRNICAMFDASEGQKETGDLRNTFAQLITDLPRCKHSLDTLQAMRSALTNIMISLEQMDFEDTQLDPLGTKNEPHIQLTSQLINVKGRPAEKNIKKTNTLNVTPQTITNACPEFAEWARNICGLVRSWTGLTAAAIALRPMIGVTDKDWQDAQRTMGPQMASAALALVFEKVHRGEVHSPSGYLRGMSRKARDSMLHLDRSFFGRSDPLIT